VGQGGSLVLPERGRVAEAGKREAEAWGTAAAMAMGGAGTPAMVVVGEFSADLFFFGSG